MSAHKSTMSMSTESTINHGGAEARATRRWSANDEVDERVRVELARDEVCSWTTRSDGEDKRGHQWGDEDDVRGARDEVHT